MCLHVIKRTEIGKLKKAQSYLELNATSSVAALQTGNFYNEFIYLLIFFDSY